MRFKNYILFVAFLIQFISSAQEFPPIEVFMPETYGAEDQNWAIDQGSDQSIYFANNKGLLVYNGAKWQLYKSTNSSIKRSVKVINDRIYTGSYMDFGYWTKNEYGVFKYTSISQEKGIDLLEDEEFWSILELQHWIIFQSLDRIYIYNTKDESFSIINSETTIIKAYKVEETIYFQKINQGIYKIESGKEVLVTNNPLLKNEIVVNIFKENGRLLYQTKEKGFFIEAGNNLVPWNRLLNLKLSQYSIYNSIQLRNGDFLLGTVSNGVLYINSKKEISLEVNQRMGLGNNTVLSLFEDKNGNVWLGLDHGISNINFNAPFRVFKDNQGVLGTVYTTLLDNNILYLGTNQGLFYKNYNTKESFKIVKGTEGQVWSLQKLKGTVFCGHDKGTFVIKNGNANQISDITGTWQIKEIKDKPNLLIQGNYNGLYILEKSNNNWQLKNKLDGYNISSRYLEFTQSEELLVNHEHKGVYRLSIDKEYKRVLDFSKLKIEKSIKSSLTKYEGSVFYGSNRGVFIYNTASKNFIKDTLFSKLNQSVDYISGKLVSANNKLFAFTKQNITYAERGKLSSNHVLQSLPLSGNIRETKDGYENILYVGNDKYLIGTTGGYIITELNANDKDDYQITIYAIEAHKLNASTKALDLTQESVLKNKENHVSFSFSVTDYSIY